jgi:hypothetical protein
VLDAQGAIDYAELVHRAVLIAEDPEHGPALRARYAAVFVDEYQDTDPAQERLLQALAGGGRDLVVVGDPDQSIYAFRGAEVRGLLEFPHRFPTATGTPAPVVALRTCRRSGASLLEASRLVAARLPAPGLAADRIRAHRDLQPVAGTPAGVVEAHTHPSVGAEADAIAELLRREHLERGTPWSRMAVLVRSGARSVPLLRRVLTAAGVPLEVAGDELPLSREPAVAPLLTALRVADDPAELTTENARALLLSPLGGADPALLRRLGRELRAADRAGRGRGGRHRRRPLAAAVAVGRARPRGARRPAASAGRRPAHRPARRASGGAAHPGAAGTGRGARDRAVGAVVRQPLAGAAGGGVPARRRHRPLRRPRPRRRRLAVLPGRPRQRPAAAHRREHAAGRDRGAADPRRHAGRARRPR